MNYQRLLRTFILIDVFAVVAAVIAAALFEGTLPEPLRAYADSEDFHPFFVIVGLILLVALITAWVGLWKAASWAPPLYAAMWLGCVVVVPFGGPYVATGAEEMFDFIGTAAGGGILALVVFAMQERRRAGLVTSAGGEATPQLWSDAGTPDRSDEPLPPHMKSRGAHIALSWLYGLTALMLLTLPYVAQTGEEGLRPDEVAKAFIFPLFFFALAVLHHVVSRGAKKRKRWARVGSIILACLLVPAVPLGTLVGVYLLRNSSWEPRSELAAGG